MDRRTALKVAAGAAASLALAPRARGWAVREDGFVDVRRRPDQVEVRTEDGKVALTAPAVGDRWVGGGVVVRTERDGEALRVTMEADSAAVTEIRLMWKRSTALWKSTLGDQWERSYGDLGWREQLSDRRMPWYVLAHTGAGTHGIGVRTGAGAFCAWECAAASVSLVCDVRSGGVGVRLGGRELRVCDVVARHGRRDESAFAAACAFCREMCPAPRAADHLVYGANDWYYAYGKNTPAGLLADADLLSELAGDQPNRPYCVIDDGWQAKEKLEQGEWSEARPSFGSMQELAASMAQRRVRPGIWMRPLIDSHGAWPAEWKLSHRDRVLDPTRPEVLEIVAADIRRLRGWGYTLIKHDYSTWDLFGRWGKDMGDGVTSDGWSFASRARTSAEVVAGLYRTIREAAGDAVVIRCNTVSHLSAGVFELNRIGDDTSGEEWDRCPRMGVNTLAFRGPHHGAFYGADADCCPVTQKLDWTRARRWLDLVSRSGTPLFVSVERAAVTPEVREALRAALSAAATARPVAQPLDWMETRTPREWIIDGKRVTYDWS